MKIAAVFGLGIFIFANTTGCRAERKETVVFHFIDSLSRESIAGVRATVWRERYNYLSSYQRVNASYGPSDASGDIAIELIGGNDWRTTAVFSCPMHYEAGIFFGSNDGLSVISRIPNSVAATRPDHGHNVDNTNIVNIKSPLTSVVGVSMYPSTESDVDTHMPRGWGPLHP